MTAQPLPRDSNGFPSGSGYAPSTGVIAIEIDATRLFNDGTQTSGPLLVTLTNPTGANASSNGALSSVGGTTSSTTLLATNSNRKTFFVYNDSSSSLYLTYGANASTTAFTFKLAPGGYYEMPNNILWTGAVSGIWDSATGNARITEVS